ncbi:laminin subunit alpha-like [Patiria miniata]|uniref:Uncharacterized protein n=1 Tax=Patiria miniata TaxID=46514 RepID=A0A914B9I7_PATMI|nr:laminin subunit alpha-like [Patiria miniata]
MTKMGKSGIFWASTFVCLCVLQQATQVGSQSSPVNVALNKPISARITCGLSGPENFYTHGEISKPPGQRVSSTCDASVPSLAHGPGSMVDLDPATGDVYTWWQSTSRNSLLSAGMLMPDTQITIDLQESYKIETIQIQMGDSVRPNQMAVFKSVDGISFTPWQYKVSSSGQCMTEFAVPLTTSVTQDSSVLCTVYSISSQPRNEVITFNFNPPQQFTEWQRARYVQFNFYNMERSFGIFSDEYHHYTVRNINVLGQCECNGHATDCTLQPVAGDSERMTYQCVCGGNTQGPTCHQCLPFYNQLAYQTGQSGFTCQECNCFGHSDVCAYDTLVGRVNGSLDASGSYNGGGVCQECQNFTAGINCQECQQFYFRPSDKLQTDEDACQSCECNIPGTREDPNTGLVKGECVMNTDRPSPSGMLPGGCYCKVNVRGSKCEECADEFYDLTDANSNGCLSCNCFTVGTVSASNICNKDATGQCPCKNFTTGRRCDQCMDGYYGLAAANPEGCLACSCDAGGALSATCDKQSGDCSCRSNIEGRQCNRVTAYSYYPSLHSISAEFESIGHANWERDGVNYPGYSWYGYVTLTGQMSTTTTLSVPPSQLSGTFEIILRAANEGATQVDLTITPRGTTAGDTQRGIVSLPLCATWCFDGVAQNVDASQGSRFTLGTGEWDVTVTVNVQGGARVLFDQVVALPVEFSEPSALLGDASDFMSACDVYNNNMRIGTSQESLCLASVFSLTAFYFDGAKPCDCNPMGSASLQCEPYGGQCQCKPGVGGRTCDMCLPEFYAFRSTGCTPCNCFGDNKVCDMTTGLCDCPPNTAGQRCDRCVIFAWGLDSTNGCQLCNCHMLGSINPQCDQTNGQCTCQLGVGGMRCDQCLDGYKELTASGCTTCQCDLAGSQGTTCDKSTGQCPCKDLTEDLTCDRCVAGGFYNSPLHRTGCLECVCMGVTAVCDSTHNRISQYTIPTDASFLANWTLVSDLSTQAVFPTSPTAAPINDTDLITVTVQAGQDAYWVLPSLTGNLLGVYGSRLRFSLQYSAQGPPESAVAKEARIYIKGLGNTYVHSLRTVPLDDLQAFSIQIAETEFLHEGTSALVNRSEFVQTLSAVDGILVSASLTVVTHQSSIGEVSYFEATGPESPLYDPLAMRALSVEQCSCGDGYTGYSCEDCAAGYRRFNVTGHPFFGQCVACNCNGHSGSCDPLTGECMECSHNTMGFNCESCADGFYGDATNGTANDCSMCPCSPPQAQTTSCSVINGNVTCSACNPGHLGPLCNNCDAFHFGQPNLPNGFCMPCFCNGNTEECNTATGQCLACGSRTTGFNCERCQDFTFGNASVRNCQDCNCDSAGSTSDPCHHSTGQCPCLPGVGNRRCDVCLPNFYNFSSEGCQACQCNEFGSSSLQCGEDGVCSCQGNVVGEKCDQCQLGYFGLPQQPCTACDCDVIGSEGGALAFCDVITGQCPCKVGVGPRRCDQCLPTYVNFTDTGCSRCDQCVDTLQNSTVDLSALWTLLWEQASLLNDLQQRDSELVVLRPQVTQTVTQLNATLASFAGLRGQIQGIDEQEFVAKVDGLVLMVGQAMEDSQMLLNNATIQLERVQALQAQAESVLEGVRQANQTARSHVGTLGVWNTSATLLPAMAQGKLDGLTVVSFDEQERLIRAELMRSQNASRDAEALLTTITSQSSASNDLSATVTSAESEFLATMQIVTDTHTLLDDIEDTLRQIGSVINQTETQLNYSSLLLSQSQSILQQIETTLTLSRADISDGNQAFADTDIIRRGAADGASGVPVDPSIDQKGQNGWISAHSAARTSDMVVANLQPVIETDVLNAESHVLTLTSAAQESSRLFEGAQTPGQEAVDVVKRYQEVVSSFAAADLMSRAANASVHTTQQTVADRTLAALQEDARRSKEDSLTLQNTINQRNTDIAGLERSLTTANETLISAEELWDTNAVSHMTLQTEANALSQIASDPQIQPAIDQGLNTANRALGFSEVTLNNTQTLEDILIANENDIQAVQETIDNATSLLGTTPAIISEVETDLTSLAQKTINLSALQNETSQMRSAIDERLARLRQKLRNVQDRIANTRQPARFAGQTSLEIQLDSPVQSKLSNEIQVDFKVDRQDGLVFFIENPANQYYSVEVVAGKAQFSFNVNRDAVTIQSPIEVCCGEWYHAIGTRYANEGQLSVVQLSTGGASTTYSRSTFMYNKYFSFPPNKTAFYVGGLPSSYQTSKVNSRSFEGCISDVMFDGQELDLWRPTSQEGSTSCCQGAVEPITPEPEVSPGASFNGFGYFQLPQDDFDVFESATVSLDFQTSVPESVLMIVTRPDLISYIGVFMESGNVMFEMNTAGNARYILRTLQTYNDATWYRVSVSFNTTHYHMDIGYANQTDAFLESFESPTLAPLRFTNLRYAFKLFLGSPDPSLASGTIRGPTNLRFAGCMKDVQLSNGTTDSLISRPLTNTSAVSYQGVSFDGCRANVAAGVGFSGPFAFAKFYLPSQLARTQSISFSFKTSEPHGILAYSYGTLSFNKLFYIALYHGNVFVQYNAGEGLSEPLQTVGLRLNTGQWQEVTVQFMGLSASLKVNDLPTIYSMRHLQTDGIDIVGLNSYLFVGGVPSTTPILIGGEFPVRRSLSGDLNDFRINSLLVNFNDASIVIDHRGLDLSGIAPPASELPPLPYPTTPAPTGTSAPMTCRDPTQIIPYPGVVRFGATENSYQAYRLAPADAALFLNSFVIRLAFHAVSPDGVLLYAANSNTNPRQFMGLVMMNGRLSFNILTDSRAMTGFNIATRERYDNALWQEVTILRINDFVAILVEKTRDYKNNGVSSDAVTSSIAINTDLYVGGIGPAISTAGFPLQISRPFDGCIRMLEVQFGTPPNLNFNLSNPTSATDVRPCSMNEVDLGGFFDGTGWLLLQNDFRIGDSLEIQFTIRTAMQNALLLAISGDAQNFIAMDIYNGLVRAIVSHGFMSSYIVRSTTLASEFAICDNQPHLLHLSFTSAALRLTIDDNPSDVASFDAGTPTVAASNGLAVYIGGIPDSTTVPLISGISTQSFHGCMQGLLINNSTTEFRNNLGSVGFTTGCPRPL